MLTLRMLRSWRRNFRLNSVLLQGGFVDIREYAQAFDQVEHDYEDAVAAFGIPFEVTESCPRERRSQTAAMCGWLPLRKWRWIAMARVDFAGVSGVPHGRAHGYVFR